jgi:protein O-GlcNAc transferase
MLAAKHPHAGFGGSPALPTLPQAMRQAAAAYVRGDWVNAEHWCRFILNAEALHFDALSLLGVIAARTRHPVDAADFLGRAVRARPNDATAHNNYGIALKNLGRFDEALRGYERALEIQRDFADAHYNRGNVLKELKRFQDALESYERALAINPGYAEAHVNRGIALQTIGRVDEALGSYERAIAINRNYAEAHHNRGVALLDLGRIDDARVSHERALEIKPDYAEAHNNRGVVLRELRRLDDALDSYERALEIKPDYAEAHNNRGVVLQELGRLDKALICYARALEIKPDYAGASINQGNAFTGLKRFDRALVSYGRAIEINPDYAEAHNNRGNALKELKRLDQALESFERAIAIKPDYAQAYFNLGNALVAMRRFDRALISYEQALEIKPGYADAHNNRGNALQELHRLDDALDSYGRALQLRPDFESLYGTWLHTKMRLCDWGDLGAHIQHLAAGIDRGEKITPPFAVLTLADSLSMQRRTAQIWANDGLSGNLSLAPIEKRGRRKRIRVGYFSADFHNHATAYLMAELIERHDRERFEVVAFSFGPDIRDDMRERLSAAFDRFVDVNTKSDEEIAQTSRDLEIDVAVDLKGYTQDQRHGIFSHRAAPVQVNYLGYPGTTAVRCMDYIIADRWLIPQVSRREYSEKVVYLPNCYQVNDRRRRIADKEFPRAELGLPLTGFVFCCFNNSYKITPETFDGWMRILSHVKGSILWLLEDNQTAVDNLRREAESRGVDAARLVFAPRMPPPEHLARHRAADLFLDTLPCNAHTTASDALWAGLPVLTRMGESFAARVAASLLNAIGLPELVTMTQEHYEALAIELAVHPGRLAEIREKLSRNRLTAPLFDTELFTRHIENAFTQMYERYQADLSPEHIFVA